MSGSSVISGNTSKSSPDSSLLTEHLNKSLCKPPRKLSQLSRPTEAPPAPPPRRHSSKPINFLLGSRLSENELLDSPLCATSEAAVQETYMSSFFQTEPLYQQFYTNQILNIGNVQFYFHFMSVLYTRWRFLFYLPKKKLMKKLVKTLFTSSADELH